MIFGVILGYKLIMLIGWVLMFDIVKVLFGDFVNLLVFRWILMLVFNSGGKLGELKVLNLFVFILWLWLLWSSLLLKNSLILVMGKFVVIYNVFRRLIWLFEWSFVSGIWELVIMIGFDKFLSMKFNVEVVYVMVFVLCKIMKLLYLL